MKFIKGTYAYVVIHGLQFCQYRPSPVFSAIGMYLSNWNLHRGCPHLCNVNILRPNPVFHDLFLPENWKEKVLRYSLGLFLYNAGLKGGKRLFSKSCSFFPLFFRENQFRDDI